MDTLEFLVVGFELIVLFWCSLTPFFPHCLAGNMEPIWLPMELRIAALATISDTMRKYSGCTGTTKFDFTDLT